MSISAKDLQAALPDLESTQCCEGLEKTVTIYRDPWGIPHIQAEGEADLFFAQGFATAQDRLWHMDFDRHQALGRWSEWAGPAGLDRDRLLRAAGMGRTAKLDYEASSPQARAMLDAYAAGVNAFLATTTALPVEYQLLGQSPEPWESWHCLAVYKMRNSLLGTFESKLWRTRLAQVVGPENLAQLIKGYPQGHLLTVPPGTEYEGEPLDSLAALSRETDPGSNAWSIAGEYTDSGLPLVAGDSHRGLDTPSVYYQVHIACPDFAVSGYSVPGVPGTLHFCHNEYVAWGMTYGSADTQDLFVERFRETADGLEYEFSGGWRSAEILREEIHVRGAASVTSEVVITHHGPIIAGDPRKGQAIAISDPGLIEGTPWADAARDAMRCPLGRGLAPSLCPLERPRQQLRRRRHPRLLRLSARGPDSGARGRKRLARRPRLERRVRVAGLHPPRRVAQSHRPRNRLCHHLQPARDRLGLSLLRRACL